jgi:hypothetical protein
MRFAPQTIKFLMLSGWDTQQIAFEYQCSEAEIWNRLARADHPALIIPFPQEMRPMSKSKNQRVWHFKVKASDDGISVSTYWDGIKEMVDASADALVAVYGKNCWARHEYTIRPDGIAFLRGPVNQYVHTTASP